MKSEADVDADVSVGPRVIIYETMEVDSIDETVEVGNIVVEVDANVDEDADVGVEIEDDIEDGIDDEIEDEIGVDVELGGTNDVELGLDVEVGSGFGTTNFKIAPASRGTICGTVFDPRREYLYGTELYLRLPLGASWSADPKLLSSAYAYLGFHLVSLTGTPLKQNLGGDLRRGHSPNLLGVPAGEGHADIVEGVALD